MANVVDIKGLDKAEVLMALFNASKQQGLGLMHTAGSKPMVKTMAESIIEKLNQEQRPLDFDYLMGRVMKVSLDGDSFNPWGYDRDVGDGAAERAIAAIRK